MESNTTNPTDGPAVSHSPGQVITPNGGPPLSPSPEFTPAPPSDTSPPVMSMHMADRPTAVAMPASNEVIVNGQAVNPLTTFGNPPAPVTKKRQIISKKLVLPAAAVLVLLGGSAAAYFGYIMPNKPQNVLAKAFSNSLSQHQLSSQGTLSVDGSGVSGKLDYVISSNEDSHTADAKLNLTISGVSVPVELISAQGNAYFKVGDLSSLFGVLNQFLGSDSAKSYESQLNKDLTNQWYTVDSTLIKEAKLDCLSNYPAPFSQSDINSLKTTYHKNPFATITSHSADKVNGAGATKFVLSIDDNTLSKTNLSSSSYFSRLQSCLQKADPSASFNLSSLKDNDKTPLTIWVDNKTKRIVKYETQSTAQDKTNGTTGDLTGTLSYGNVNISAPTGAKPVLSLLNDLNLSSLENSFNSGAGAAVSGAADAERKTDLSALQAQLEAYQADNGYYPTLAELNSASWRAANLQGFDGNALKDPAGSSPTLAASPANHVYAYQVTPAGCNNTTSKCTSYILTATLDNGSTYVKQALNSDSSLPSNVN